MTDEPEVRSADADFEREMDELDEDVEEPSSEQKNFETLLQRIEELEADKILLQSQIHDLETEKLRIVAEGQTFRRRMLEQAETSRKFATESLVRDLIPALDNFERTLAASDNGATLENLLIGVRMIDKQLRDALKSVQVERIPSLGQQFDPEFHEAIGTVEVEGRESGEVVDELEAGYTMNGRVLRAARVRVAQ